ncbi:Hypothetical predicted protein [Cloeon dipterum]|uniref:limulus clotting factor C n=1 Tax=Cloeon dipterum TaxID=197152 RepID=A0A8S1CD17_9INSE|nr:Hypothetical predicted protein [Cloeon dipterum]
MKTRCLLATAPCVLLLAALASCDLQVVSKEVPPKDPPLNLPESKTKLVPDKRLKLPPQAKDAGKLASFDEQIVGGKGANRGQWPWQVFVTMNNVAICGGSLIYPQWVLTAAHCADTYTNFTLQLGAVDRNSFENGRVSVETTQKFVHPNYNRVNFNNDIALLKLPSPLFQTSTAFIGSVKLPTDQKNTYEGQMATASGWGKLNDSLSIPTKLQYVSMPVISNSKCVNVFGSTYVINSNICTNTTGSMSTCQGDSGGPLVHFNSMTSTYTLIGATSFGAQDNCGTGKYPVVFTRVSSHLAWIASTVALQSFLG